MRIYIEMELSAAQRAWLSRQLGVSVVGRTEATAWVVGKLREMFPDEGRPSDGWRREPVSRRELRVLELLRGARAALPRASLRLQLGLDPRDQAANDMLDAVLTRLRRKGEAWFERGQGWVAAPATRP